MHRPRGLMDKASDFGSEDCEFESRRGQNGKFSSSIGAYRGGLVVTSKAPFQIQVPREDCLLLQSIRHVIYLYMLLQIANVRLQNGKGPECQ